MSLFPRREIAEILEIMEREKEIYSIFVEGDIDKDISDIYLEAKGIGEKISVYSIDTVDVPNEILEKYGLGFGSNKHRVVALALEISMAGDAEDRAFCVVDADCDRVLSSIVDTPALTYTDFTCLEMYALSQNNLSRFLRLSCNLDNGDFISFLEMAGVILPALFIMRCCSQKLELNLRFPAASAGFRDSKDPRSFVFDKYFTAALHANGMHARRQELLAECENIERSLDPDIRHKSQGHDALALLFYYLKKKNSLKLNEGEIQQYGPRLLWQALSLNEIDEHNLFKKISGLPNVWRG